MDTYILSLCSGKSRNVHEAIISSTKIFKDSESNNILFLSLIDKLIDNLRRNLVK